MRMPRLPTGIETPVTKSTKQGQPTVENSYLRLLRGTDWFDGFECDDGRGGMDAGATMARTNLAVSRTKVVQCECVNRLINCEADDEGPISRWIVPRNVSADCIGRELEYQRHHPGSTGVPSDRQLDAVAMTVELRQSAFPIIHPAFQSPGSLGKAASDVGRLPN